MSRKSVARRPSPLRGADGKGIDKHVQATLQKSARLANGKERKDYKVSLPVELAESIKTEASALTGHKRRGWSDLVTILLRYGWDAYQAGELEVGTQQVVVEQKIVAVQE